MEGYEVVTMEEATARADIFVTATGNMDVITLDHMRAMKNMAIVCNIGHFDSEIQIGALANLKWTEIKPQVDEVEFAGRKKIIAPVQGTACESWKCDRTSKLRHEFELHQSGARPN